MTIAGTWEPLQRIAELDATVEAQARELEKLRSLLQVAQYQLSYGHPLRQQIRAALGENKS